MSSKISPLQSTFPFTRHAKGKHGGREWGLQDGKESKAVTDGRRRKQRRGGREKQKDKERDWERVWRGGRGRETLRSRGEKEERERDAELCRGDDGVAKRNMEN